MFEKELVKNKSGHFTNSNTNGLFLKRVVAVAVGDVVAMAVAVVAMEVVAMAVAAMEVAVAVGDVAVEVVVVAAKCMEYETIN